MKKNQAAVILGRKGGKVRSELKLSASRNNGRLGGRPKLSCVPISDRVRRVLRKSDWRIEFFEFVDDFRKNPRKDLIEKKPSEKDVRLYSLVTSMVLFLCSEQRVPPPDWAAAGHWLVKPYFVGDFQSLKASALRESPVEFRRNNIWVLKNFMERV
ncbi:MAG: hypothetical protein HY537_14835 [Deltaproteobacteria bacterium]|nr:hypothetical protein [Deltaproteobacteria bacterium]